jgi:microcin C transport system substrate-binding protein
LEHQVNRRSLLTSTLLALASRQVPLLAWTSRAEAQAASSVWRHGVSLFGDLKYPFGFMHFDYVKADAPKVVAARLTAIGTYDNFNTVVAGAKGSLAAGIPVSLPGSAKR